MTLSSCISLRSSQSRIPNGQFIVASRYARKRDPNQNLSRTEGVLPPELVAPEWNAPKEAADTFGDVVPYVPHLDIAVGPFNTTFKRRNQDADAIRSFKHAVVRRLKKAIWDQNHCGIYKNRNPRCLIAIEIEHRTSSKHILGGITNASMLGLFGVVVGSAPYIEKVRRIHAYACQLLSTVSFYVFSSP
jgi:hypothetical protein